MYGREPIVPADIVLGLDKIQTNKIGARRFAEDLRERLKYTYDTVKAHMEKCAYYSAKGYNQKVVQKG